MPIRAKASRYTVLLLRFDQSSINPFFFHAPLRQRNIMPTARPVSYTHLQVWSEGYSIDKASAESGRIGYSYMYFGNETYSFNFPFFESTEDAIDRKSTRLNSSHIQKSRMPSSA